VELELALALELELELEWEFELEWELEVDLELDLEVELELELEAELELELELESELELCSRLFSGPSTKGRCFCWVFVASCTKHVVFGTRHPGVANLYQTVWYYFWY